MRTFIAIELPREIKDYLAIIQNQLRNSGADVKWVEPNNIHLTIKFLGEVDALKLDNIIKIAADIAQDKNSFYMRIASLGAFPKINFPRVIWIGIDKGDKETENIAEELEEKIAKVGIPKESRKFSSHITIGRVKTELNRLELVKSLNDIMDSLEKKHAEFLVNKITLFKSTLTPKGPIYESLKEFKLITN